MAQQYGYGYGYQQYPYAQPSAPAVPPAAAAPFMGYSPRVPPYTPSSTPGPAAAHQGQQQQQANVGYTPYAGSNNQAHTSTGEL